MLRLRSSSSDTCALQRWQPRVLVRANSAASAVQTGHPSSGTDAVAGLLLCIHKGLRTILQEANVHVRAPRARDAQSGPLPPLLLAVRRESEDALGPAAQVCTA